MPAFLDICESAARAGGEVLLSWRGRFTAREKGPNDLVTEADLASQQAIREQIAAVYPDHRFLGEEDDETATTDANVDSEYEWIVDPLDGTCNYVHGMPSFSVSVALAKQGEVIAGVVYDPIADECFAAEKGAGATLNGEPIRVSSCETLGEALLASSFSTKVDRDSPEISRFVEVLTQAQAVRRLGSAALNMCYVASGRLDGYWATSVKKWDVAAGLCILLEAGGVITRLDESPFDLEDPKFAAAATLELHGELVQKLQMY